MSKPPLDDDRTLMLAASVASGIKAPSTQEGDSNALRPGVYLSEFEILSVIGIGGFGIVYLAYDHSLQRKIALKEYMPSSLAARSSSLHVTVKSDHHAETFQAGMRSFINEAQLLARFDHPSLVKVYRFWEANDTAYMAMPFYEGLTLTQTLRSRDMAPNEEWLKSLLAPLLDVLEAIHVEQCFHRDIAPDNILMLAGDRPLLLDFGAARRSIGGMAQAFTVILKPGYAPIEQYANIASMQQGAWTDIYALASVVHFSIISRPPIPSISRIVSDQQIPLVQSASGQYSDEFLRVIDRALSVQPKDRPQSVAELRYLLGMKSTKSRLPSETILPKQLESSNPPEAPKQIVHLTGKVEKPPRNTRLTRVPAIGAGILLLVAASIYFIKTQGDAPLTMILKALPRGSLPLTDPSMPGTVQPTSVAKELPIEKPVDPIQVLNQIYQARNPKHEVTISLEKRKVRIGKDYLRFSIHSSEPGYVYLLMVGTDRAQFWLLFPNAIDKNNRISAAKQLDLPRSHWRMNAAGPPGINQFLAVVSDSPRDFSAVRLKSQGPFSEFALNTMVTPARESHGESLIFAGQAKCVNDKVCSKSYGAAMFSIEEVLTQ